MDVATHGGYYVEESGKTIYGTSYATARLTGVIAAAKVTNSEKSGSLSKADFFHNVAKREELSDYIIDGKVVDTYEGR